MTCTTALSKITNYEIKIKYEANADTNAYTDTERAKLLAVEHGADRTTHESVMAAGAVMFDTNSVAGMGFVSSNVTLSFNPDFTVPTATAVRTFVENHEQYHEYVNKNSFPMIGKENHFYRDIARQELWGWDGVDYTLISRLGVESVNLHTGIVTLNKGDIGLANVDDTSDVNKEISWHAQNQFDRRVTSDQVLTNVPVHARFTDTILLVEDVKDLYERNQDTNALTNRLKTQLINTCNASAFMAGRIAKSTGVSTPIKSLGLYVNSFVAPGIHDHANSFRFDTVDMCIKNTETDGSLIVGEYESAFVDMVRERRYVYVAVVIKSLLDVLNISEFDFGITQDTANRVYENVELDYEDTDEPGRIVLTGMVDMYGLTNSTMIAFRFNNLATVDNATFEVHQVSLTW